MSDVLLEERHDSIVVLRMNLPESRNALSPDMVDAIEAACLRLNGDMSVGCAVLTGIGRHFSSGGNVKEMHARTGMFGGSSASMYDAFRHGIQRIPKALYDLEVPIIAAVNGAAIGAGLDLALMCDIRIASEEAVFAESFLRLGLVSGDGGSWFLQRAIGPARAAEMTLTAEPIDANTAERWGLVSRIVPQDKVLDAAMEMAGKIAAHPRRSARLSKRLLRDSQQLDLRGGLELAAAMQSILQHTVDQQEAVRAFIDKRAPHFTGD